MKLKEIQHLFHQELDALYGSDEVNSFFFMLTEAYFDISRLQLALDPQLVISKPQETMIFQALSELKLSKPIQHILGNAYFFGLDFVVNNHTLIPRPETEELVQWILDDISKESSTKTLKILDIGTGSGCIPIALKKHLANASIYALDISAEALQIARQNAAFHKVSIDFVQADVLFLKDLNLFGTANLSFDIIVSNPPYVRNLEKAQMHKNVLDHEPETALFVDNDNPLLFYIAIADLAKENLAAGGRLYFEINQYLGDEMMILLEEKQFCQLELRQDFLGADRMMKAIRG